MNFWVDCTKDTDKIICVTNQIERQNLNEEMILELTFFLQKLTFNLGFLDLNVQKLVLKGMSNTEIYKGTMNT